MAEEKDQLPQHMLDAGYMLGKSSDELPAHSPQDNFYADHEAYQEPETPRQTQQEDPHDGDFPATRQRRWLSRGDRDLLRRIQDHLETNPFPEAAERELGQQIQARLDEALAECTDDELSAEELEAQTKGSW